MLVRHCEIIVSGVIVKPSFAKSVIVKSLFAETVVDPVLAIRADFSDGVDFRLLHVASRAVVADQHLKKMSDLNLKFKLEGYVEIS